MAAKQPQDDKHERLGKLLSVAVAAMDEDKVTHTDFIKQFAKVIEHVKESDAKQTAAIQAIAEMLTAKALEIEMGVGAHKNEAHAMLKGLSDQVTATIQKAEQRIATIRDGIDGKDADEPAVVATVMEQIKLPEYRAPIMDGPEEIRDKLELLQGDERLTIDAIKDLREELDKLRKQVGKGGAVIASQRGQVKVYDLSASLNGVTTTFALPAFWRVLTVDLSSFPNALRPTVDWTSDAAAMTITFTSQIDPSTSLAAGQTCIVTYAEA